MWFLVNTIVCPHFIPLDVVLVSASSWSIISACPTCKPSDVMVSISIFLINVFGMYPPHTVGGDSYDICIFLVNIPSVHLPPTYPWMWCFIIYIFLVNNLGLSPCIPSDMIVSISVFSWWITSVCTLCTLSAPSRSIPSVCHRFILLDMMFQSAFSLSLTSVYSLHTMGCDGFDIRIFVVDNLGRSSWMW